MRLKFRQGTEVRFLSSPQKKFFYLLFIEINYVYLHSKIKNMVLIHIVETIDEKISSILSFPIEDESKEKEVEKEVNATFIELINRFQYPATLSEDSEKHWIEQKIYHHKNHLRLEIVSSQI